MNLKELIIAVKEENLSKGQLEEYEMKLASIYAEMMMRIGELKKERALYFLERQRPDVSDVSIRRVFDATGDGQELIELEANVKAVSRILSSIKSRIYQSY